jgi:hypothetical protein
VQPGWYAVCGKCDKRHCRRWLGPGVGVVMETVVSPKDVALERLTYTASEVLSRVGRA